MLLGEEVALLTKATFWLSLLGREVYYGLQLPDWLFGHYSWLCIESIDSVCYPRQFSSKTQQKITFLEPAVKWELNAETFWNKQYIRVNKRKKAISKN